MLKMVPFIQGRRKNLKLGGGDTARGYFFLTKKWVSSKNKKGISLFIAKSWGEHVPHCPPAPTPMLILFDRFMKIGGSCFVTKIVKS